MEKAVKKGDTQAYNAIKDRLRGKAQQNIEIGTKQPIMTLYDARKKK